MTEEDNDKDMLRNILGQDYSKVSEESRAVGMTVLKWARENKGGMEAIDSTRSDVRDAIYEVLSERYHCDARAVIADERRRQKNVELRYVAYKIYREITGSSLTETAKALGSRVKHCTVLHGINKIEDLVAYYGSFREFYEGTVRDVIQRIEAH